MNERISLTRTYRTRGRGEPRDRGAGPTNPMKNIGTSEVLFREYTFSIHRVNIDGINYLISSTGGIVSEGLANPMDNQTPTQIQGLSLVDQYKKLRKEINDKYAELISVEKKLGLIK